MVHRGSKCELNCNPFHSSVSVCGSGLSLSLLAIFLSLLVILARWSKNLFSVGGGGGGGMVSGKEEWVAIYCMQSDIYVYVCIVDTIIMNKHFVVYNVLLSYFHFHVMILISLSRESFKLFSLLKFLSSPVDTTQSDSGSSAAKPTGKEYYYHGLLRTFRLWFALWKGNNVI